MGSKNSRPGTDFAKAQRLQVLTDGVFDPCLPAMPGRLSDIEFCGEWAASAPSVVCHAPLALDLGGIAKGYAVDCAVDALIAAGADAGLVNAGGDLRLFGARPQTILLRHANSSYETVVLQDIALAVSDLEALHRPPQHRGYYLRVSAAPAARGHAAVLAAHAVVADALSTCALLCDDERVQRALLAFSARRVGSVD